MAAELLETRAQIDVSDLLPQVRTPTLVLHAREDVVVSDRRGPPLAAGIPGAQFVELHSKNHILLEHEPAWRRFREAVLAFLGLERSGTREKTRPSRRSRHASGRCCP